MEKPDKQDKYRMWVREWGHSFQQGLSQSSLGKGHLGETRRRWGSKSHGCLGEEHSGGARTNVERTFRKPGNWSEESVGWCVARSHRAGFTPRKGTKSTLITNLCVADPQTLRNQSSSKTIESHLDFTEVVMGKLGRNFIKSPNEHLYLTWTKFYHFL